MALGRLNRIESAFAIAATDSESWRRVAKRQNPPTSHALIFIKIARISVSFDPARR
jgi:hypothetical protein